MKPKQQEGTRKATCRPTQGHWHQMNRKQRRETMRRIQRENLSLEVVHPDAAGIDIGNEFHYVAVPPTRDGGTGTSVRVHHNRVEVDGRLAEAMPDSNRRDAVDWRVLDRGIRHPRGGWYRSVPGECAGNEESTRAQKRRTREPMADEAAHLRLIAEFVSPLAGDPHDADVLAPAQCLGARGGTARPPDSEGADPNECSIGQ